MADISRAIEEVSKKVDANGSISTSDRWYQVLDQSRNLPYVQTFLAQIASKLQ